MCSFLITSSIKITLKKKFKIKKKQYKQYCNFIETAFFVLYREGKKLDHDLPEVCPTRIRYKRVYVI
jgi:hypothetical protein